MGVFGFMLIYIMVAAFSMVSLITGIIGEGLQRAQDEDEQDQLERKKADREELVKNINEELNKLDSEEQGVHFADGKLDESKIIEAFSDEDNKAAMAIKKKFTALDMGVIDSK